MTAMSERACRFFRFPLLLGVACFSGCSKEDPAPTTQQVIVVIDTVNIPPDAVADVDGNVYTTVVIGGQRWMAENLRTTHYDNGDPIDYEPTSSEWALLETAAWSNYDNDANYDQLYGKLYNWYAVIDQRNVCPSGWHVPTDEEWQVLESWLGMPQAELTLSGLRGDSLQVGGKLKALVYWESPNLGATDASGFSGFPGGDRVNNGSYASEGDRGFWWTSTEASASSARQRALAFDQAGIFRTTPLKEVGASVRCIED